LRPRGEVAVLDLQAEIRHLAEQRADAVAGAGHQPVVDRALAKVASAVMPASALCVAFGSRKAVSCSVFVLMLLSVAAL